VVVKTLTPGKKTTTTTTTTTTITNTTALDVLEERMWTDADYCNTDSCAVAPFNTAATAAIQRQQYNNNNTSLLLFLVHKKNKTASLVWSVGRIGRIQHNKQTKIRDNTRRDDIYTTQQPRTTTIGYYRTEHIRMPPHPSMPFL
jgi:hypothetical protein